MLQLALVGAGHLEQVGAQLHSCTAALEQQIRAAVLAVASSAVGLTFFMLTPLPPNFPDLSLIRCRTAPKQELFPLSVIFL